MSEVSRFMTSPSLEGTLADSLISCVRIDISLLDLNGYTRCTPSGSTSPVTRPKRVSTPTFPDSTFATDENSNRDRKSTRLNSSHSQISYAVFCLKKKKKQNPLTDEIPSLPQLAPTQEPPK